MSVPCECPDHVCTPDPVQTERYQTREGWALCAACAVQGHGSTSLRVPRPDPIIGGAHDRVVSCLACGATLGIYQSGERPPDYVHECTT